MQVPLLLLSVVNADSIWPTVDCGALLAIDEIDQPDLVRLTTHVTGDGLRHDFVASC